MKVQMEDERVTEIRKLGKGRYLLFLENGLQLPLYRQELSECGISVPCAGQDVRQSGSSDEVLLKEDTPLSPDSLERSEYSDVISGKMLSCILTEILPKRAQLRAMHLLEKMDRTESQLREKLRQSYYPEFIIDDAIKYVKSYHYIDDLRYARNFLETHAETKSRRLMEQELYTKGVSKEIVAQAVSETEFPDEEEQIRSLLKKKHYNFSCEDKKMQQRACSFLMRKGYNISVILSVLRAAEE